MFSRRIRIFTLFGFEVWIDASWLLVAALIAWTLAAGVFPQTLPGLAAPTYWWMAVVATIGLFASIVFHETAHALVARRYGIEIRGITLFVFGGVAQLPAEPGNARAEFLMALAGPVASLVLAAALLALCGALRILAGPQTIAAVIWYLGLLNGALAIFNLVPAFPLDGGRMLRAALWGWRQDIGWATRIAAGIGDGFGLLLIVFGVVGVLRGNLVGGVWQVLIGMFLRSAAGAGYRQTMAQRLLAGISVREVMTPDPIAVSPDLPVSRFVDEYVYRYHHREFPVTRNGILIGSVGTKEVAALDRRRWPLTPVAAIALACAPADTIALEAAALDAIAQMTGAGRGRLFVVRDGRLVGILSQRDLVELLSVRLDLIGGRNAAPARRLWSRKRAPG
jgi:Zn-dependent protease